MTSPIQVQIGFKMNHSIFKNLFKVMISFLLYYSGISILLLKKKIRNGLYVFNYHNFNTFQNSYWEFGSLFETRYQKNFQEQIIFYSKYLKRFPLHRARECTFNFRFFMLTFDDGYKDNFDVALPIIRQYQIPSIFFVTTNFIGSHDKLWFDHIRFEYEKRKSGNWIYNILLKKKCRKHLSDYKSVFKYGTDQKTLSKQIKFKQTKSAPLMMNWEELSISAQKGVTIAPHTCTHPILSCLEKDEIYWEISSSHKKIKEKLKTDCLFFCYPDGSDMSINDAVVSKVKECGIPYAFTTVRGVNRNLKDPLRLKRIGINPSDPLPIVAMKIIASDFFN